MDIPVFVINLPQCAQRRDDTTRKLHALGVSFQYIEGIDGARIPEDDIFRNEDFAPVREGLRSRYLLRGEIGCALSHLGIFKKMVAEGIPRACILEDDIDTYRQEFPLFLSSVNLRRAHWDLLFLGQHRLYARKEVWCKNKVRLGLGNYCIGEPVEAPMGSYGYVIKKAAAEKILRHAYPIRMAFDYYIGRAAALGICTRVVTPACVSHNYAAPSTIYAGAAIIYKYPLLESFRKRARTIYRLLPFLLPLRLWMKTMRRRPWLFFRKTGMLKNSYAKYI